MIPESIKVVFLGDSGVGKTTIANRYITGSSVEPKPTIGAAFLTKITQYHEKEVQMYIWDTSGQEAYRGLAPMYYRSAVIALVVYDITNLESFKSVEYWIEQLRVNVGEKIVIIIVGNKLDLESSRLISTSKGEDLAKKFHALYIEISAKTGAGVDRTFQMCISQYFSTIEPDPDVPPTIQVASESPVNNNRCC